MSIGCKQRLVRGALDSLLFQILKQACVHIWGAVRLLAKEAKVPFISDSDEKLNSSCPDIYINKTLTIKTTIYSH
jgi:hypothetical protein